ncbi:hypothetical protein [Thermoanaerobacter kivui]|nr:hypothetical protein [Thermoanaerobacter kivui]
MPIDLKSILPRIVEVGNLKQIDVQRANVYTQQMAVSYHKETEVKKTKTNELEKAEKAVIKDQQRSGEKGKKEKEKNKKNQKNIGHIDIKV